MKLSHPHYIQAAQILPTAFSIAVTIDDEKQHKNINQIGRR
jgi:hypothetical protein